jgi:hypothetical protein
LPHGRWSDWSGKDDTDAPRPLMTAITAKLLTVFRIRPATIWPLGRNADSKSSRGYHRSQFKDAWNRYCPEPGGRHANTPQQDQGNPRQLSRHKTITMAARASGGTDGAEQGSEATRL